jgi:membrane protein
MRGAKCALSRTAMMRWVRSMLGRMRRLVVAVGWRFYADNCLLQASALAYVSLLSLVPLFALMFAVLKGLGVQRRLEPFLLSRLALDHDVASRIVGYIDQTNVRTLGALGAVGLVFTALSVLGSVEASFNLIWRVRQSRTWWRKLTDYLGTVLLTPLLLLTAVALTSSLQDQALLQLMLRTQYVGGVAVELLRVTPIVINAVALAILYAVMPNRHPYVPGILLGAMVAGCLWQIAQWAYVTIGVRMVTYNAIYGTLSQLPVTLVWFYVSWTIILGGAELAAVHEFGPDIALHRQSASRWAVALHLLARAADRFHGPGGGIDPRATAKELRVETDMVMEVIETLRNAGFLAAVDDGQQSYVLARDPRTIVLAEVDTLLEVGLVPAGCDPRVKTWIAKFAGQRDGSPQRLSDVLGEAES